MNSYPELVVFDLDECLWYPEMYTLDTVPSEKDAVRGTLGELQQEGVIGCKSGRDTISLYPGALRALQQFHAGNYPNMRIAAASSADTPQAVRIGRAALSLLEVAPGVTVRQVFALGWPEGFEGNLQIGRSPPLSSQKERTHFPILREQTKVEYSCMLFFDDCNWGDHVGNVTRACPGVVGVRTPHGLREEEWDKGLRLFAETRK